MRFYLGKWRFDFEWGNFNFEIGRFESDRHFAFLANERFCFTILLINLCGFALSIWLRK